MIKHNYEYKYIVWLKKGFLDSRYRDIYFPPFVMIPTKGSSFKFIQQKNNDPLEQFIELS